MQRILTLKCGKVFNLGWYPDTGVAIPSLCKCKELKNIRNSLTLVTRMGRMGGVVGMVDYFKVEKSFQLQSNGVEYTRNA